MSLSDSSTDISSKTARGDRGGGLCMFQFCDFLRTKASSVKFNVAIKTRVMNNLMIRRVTETLVCLQHSESSKSNSCYSCIGVDILLEKLINKNSYLVACGRVRLKKISSPGGGGGGNRGILGSRKTHRDFLGYCTFHQLKLILT